MSISIQDLLTALQNGVTAINGLQTTLLANGNCYVMGDVTALNTLSTTAITVAAQDQERTFLLFHNPSSGVTLYIGPTESASGAALTPVAASPGGTFVLLPQDYLQLSGNCQSAWRAVSSSGSANPLTVVSF